MSRKRVKQYLMLLTVVGVVSIASGSGTFATFNAQVTNPGNTFAAGTLFLHDTPNGGTVCTSESATTGPNFNVNPGDGTNGDNCAALFTNGDLSAGAVTAHIALQNAGSLPSSSLKFSASSCTWSNNNATTGSTVTFATPTDCSGLYVTVQETQSNYTTNVYCAYGPSTTQPACDAPNNTATLANVSSLTQLKTTAAANATLAAGATRYYVITVSPAGVGSGNALQNLKVTFGLTWHIDE